MNREHLNLRCESRRSRRGFALIAALTCVLVALSLATNMLAAALRTRRAGVDELAQRQAALLAEAGLVRAAAKFSADDAYDGETWRLAADAIGPAAEGDAEIVIAVSTEQDSGPRQIRVAATYPLDSPRPVRHSLVAELANPVPSQEP